MKSEIMLKTPEEAEEFVNAASACDFDVDLHRGAVYIDAKSILGVLTMGIKRRMDVICDGTDMQFDNVVKKFAVA